MTGDCRIIDHTVSPGRSSELSHPTSPREAEGRTGVEITIDGQDDSKMREAEAKKGRARTGVINPSVVIAQKYFVCRRSRPQTTKQKQRPNGDSPSSPSPG